MQPEVSLRADVGHIPQCGQLNEASNLDAQPRKGRLWATGEFYLATVMESFLGFGWASEGMRMFRLSQFPMHDAYMAYVVACKERNIS